MVKQDTASTPSKERYSYTKLSSWWICPYGWMLRYVNHQLGIGNAFSSYGKLVHSIMERYAKGELEVWDLADVYEWEFDSEVPEEFPYNKHVVLRDKYYKEGLEFLRSFPGYNDYKILGVEQRFEIDVDDWILNGVIDILLEDKDGKLIIRDYKSQSSFKNKEEQRECARQLYLYSMYIYQKFGRFPDELQFLIFREQKLITIPFDISDYNEAIQWAKDTVKVIREAFDYPPKCRWFYSKYLCNHREYCDLRGVTLE